MGTGAFALVPVDGELSDFARSRLTPDERRALARLGPERFRRWAQAGVRSRTAT